jgi:hypothetical protein
VRVLQSQSVVSSLQQLSKGYEKLTDENKKFPLLVATLQELVSELREANDVKGVYSVKLLLRSILKTHEVIVSF